MLRSCRRSYIRLGFYREKISCNEGHNLYQPCRLLISLWCKEKQHQTASQQIDSGQKRFLLTASTLQVSLSNVWIFLVTLHWPYVDVTSTHLTCKTNVLLLVFNSAGIWKPDQDDIHTTAMKWNYTAPSEQSGTIAEIDFFLMLIKTTMSLLALPGEHKYIYI